METSWTKWNCSKLIVWKAGKRLIKKGKHMANLCESVLWAVKMFRQHQRDKLQRAVDISWLGEVKLNHSPSGSSSLGILSSFSAMRKASSRFCLLLLVLALDRSTRSGRRAYRIARKTTPLLQLALKSFTFNEHPALRETNHYITFIIQVILHKNSKKVRPNI